MAIKIRLRELIAGDSFTTLLTQRKGEVQAGLGRSSITQDMVVTVHLNGDIFDRELHPDVVVGLTAN